MKGICRHIDEAGSLADARPCFLGREARLGRYCNGGEKELAKWPETDSRRV